MACNPRSRYYGDAKVITVACVLRSGGIYDASWVRRLRAGVDAHLHVDHKFVCLTDMRVPCPSTPLIHDWPGWWSKCELFRLPGTVLFFDLDTLVVGDLGDAERIAQETDRLVMLRDFYRAESVGSGVMAWNGKCNVFDIYRAFRDDAHNLMQAHKGDQECIEEIRKDISRWQDVLPGQFVSYKAHVRTAERRHETGTGDIPPDARAICLHGEPKFCDMPADSLVRTTWEQAA